ncbi:MAG TPA: hypothetical protein VNY29_11065 [Terriglobales bacterium]|nr:hypothetical protein [Terriglobales bacterium]
MPELRQNFFTKEWRSLPENEQTTDRSQAMALMSDVHVTDVLRIYKARYDELSVDPRLAHVTIFNHWGRRGNQPGAPSSPVDR